jgi:hypothetical protein
MADKPELKMECLDVSGKPFRLEIPGLLPSGNELMRLYNGRTFRKGGKVIRSKYAYTKIKKIWWEKLDILVRISGQESWRAPGKVRVDYTVFRPGNRPLDQTNAQIAVDKLIIDCLVKQTNNLKDDSPKFLEWGRYAPVRCAKGDARVIIELKLIGVIRK